MKNVTYLGLCWTMVFGLVAVALGQQSPRGGAMPLYPVLQPGQPNSGTLPAPEKLPQSDDSATSAPTPPTVSNRIGTGSPRSELGVWMTETGGQGVRILRIMPGSAADQAGLQAGDVILKINGQSATTPRETAAAIRQTPAGEKATLSILRDGSQQAVTISMLPLGEAGRERVDSRAHEASFKPSDSTEADLSSRTQRLEQQVNKLTVELATIRQELARTQGLEEKIERLNLGVAEAHALLDKLYPTAQRQSGYKADVNQVKPLQADDRYSNTPRTPPAAANPVTPPPGFGGAEKDLLKPIGDSPKAATPPAPSGDIKPLDDPFAPSTTPPKNEAKPKAGSDNGTTDDLFK